MTFQWEQHVIEGGDQEQNERRLRGIINHVTSQNERFRLHIVKLHALVFWLATALVLTVAGLILAFANGWIGFG